MAGSMLQVKMAGKVISDEVWLATMDGGTHRTHYLRARVRMFGAHVLGQGRIGEPHLVAVRTREALRVIGNHCLAAIV